MSRALDDALERLAHACATFSAGRPGRAPDASANMSAAPAPMADPAPLTLTGTSNQALRENSRGLHNEPSSTLRGPPFDAERRPGFVRPGPAREQRNTPLAPPVSRWRRFVSGAADLFHRVTPW
jgi:hypothetical protein